MQSFLSQRYSEAYSVTSGTIVFGMIIKRLSVIFAVLTLIAIVVTAVSQIDGFSSLEVYGLEALIELVCIVGFLGGIIVMSQGQMMLAVLDTAVNTSVVATTEEKVEIFNRQIGGKNSVTSGNNVTSSNVI